MGPELTCARGLGRGEEAEAQQATVDQLGGADVCRVENMTGLES